MLFYIAAVLCFVAALLLVARPYWGILLTLAINPVVAATWETRIGDFSLNHVIGVIVPVFVLPRLISVDLPHPNWARLKLIAVLFLLANLIGVMALISEGKAVTAIETSIHAMNGFIAFYLFAVYYRSSEGIKHLTIALLISGIFPVAMGLYQAATGVVWHQRSSAGILRYVGMYHDAVSLKHFGLQTLLAIYIALHQFKLSQLQKTLLLGFGACSCVVIFNVYSKSALAILCAWFLIWALLQNRFVGAAIIGAIVALVNAATQNFLVNSVLQLFQKEIAFNQGELDRRFLLAGRVSIWEDLYNDWKLLPFGEQLFGTGDAIPAHNEFLRILITDGLVGLAAFLLATILATSLAASTVLRNKGPLQIAAALAVAMWGIDCIGIHPGLYSYYMWFVWGIVGLAVTLSPSRGRQPQRPAVARGPTRQVVHNAG